MAGHLGLIAMVTFFHVSNNLQSSRVRGFLAEPHPLTGVYRVERFEQSGAVDRENEDDDRWVRVGLNPPRQGTIQWATGEAERRLMSIDDEASTISLYDRGGQAPAEPQFTVTRVDSLRIRLVGEFEGKPTSILMRRSEREALLAQRGFRWINEFPFNR